VADASPLRVDAINRDFAAWLGLWAAGLGLIAFCGAAPWIVRAGGYGVFIPALAAIGVATIVATRLVASLPTRPALIVVLGLAVVMRLLLVAEEPLLSSDLFRYVWDGRVQAAGVNPYRFVPADPALAALRDAAIYPHINRADYAMTAYPPFAQIFFLAVTRISESIVAMRLAMVGCEIVIVAVVIDILRKLRRPEATVVAYAWHPLAIFEVANNGHVEALMVAIIMLGVWLLVRQRRGPGAVAVSLAALVKPYAMLILPVFWRPWDWRVPLAILITVLLCYLPYLGAGSGALGFMSGGYAAEEGLLTGTGIWLTALLRSAFGAVPGLVPVYFVAAAAVMIALGLRYRFDPQRAPRQTISAVFVLLTAGLLLLSPNYAWYLLVLVPFIPLGGGAIAWALTLGAFMLYRPIYLGEANDLIWKSLAIMPFLLVSAIMLAGRAFHRSRQVDYAA
jgi:alpha-1,6-mannosyltransferase